MLTKSSSTRTVLGSDEEEEEEEGEEGDGLARVAHEPEETIEQRSDIDHTAAAAAATAAAVATAVYV
eukprot:COSAG01_NODE_10937_length_2043_cov_24.532922_4_plen_67_part_00